MGPAEGSDDAVAGEESVVAGVGVAHDGAGVVGEQGFDPFGFTGAMVLVKDTVSAGDGPEPSIVATAAIVDGFSMHGVVNANAGCACYFIKYGFGKWAQEGGEADQPSAEFIAWDMGTTAREAFFLAVGW